MRGSLIKNAELEADRLGISIVARAGYNTETAARFLQGLGLSPRVGHQSVDFRALGGTQRARHLVTASRDRRVGLCRREAEPEVVR